MAASSTSKNFAYADMYKIVLEQIQKLNSDAQLSGQEITQLKAYFQQFPATQNDILQGNYYKLVHVLRGICGSHKDMPTRRLAWDILVLLSYHQQVDVKASSVNRFFFYKAFSGIELLGEVKQSTEAIAQSIGTLEQQYPTIASPLQKFFQEQKQQVNATQARAAVSKLLENPTGLNETDIADLNLMFSFFSNIMDSVRTDLKSELKDASREYYAKAIAQYYQIIERTVLEIPEELTKYQVASLQKINELCKDYQDQISSNQQFISAQEKKQVTTLREQDNKKVLTIQNTVNAWLDIQNRFNLLKDKVNNFWLQCTTVLDKQVRDQKEIETALHECKAIQETIESFRVSSKNALFKPSYLISNMIMVCDNYQKNLAGKQTELEDVKFQLDNAKEIAELVVRQEALIKERDSRSYYSHEAIALINAHDVIIQRATELHYPEKLVQKSTEELDRRLRGWSVDLPRVSTVFEVVVARGKKAVADYNKRHNPNTFFSPCGAEGAAGPGMMRDEKAVSAATAASTSGSVATAVPSSISSNTANLASLAALTAAGVSHMPASLTNSPRKT